MTDAIQNMFVDRSKFVGGKSGSWIRRQSNETHLHQQNQDDQVLSGMIVVAVFATAQNSFCLVVDVRQFHFVLLILLLLCDWLVTNVGQ